MASDKLVVDHILNELRNIVSSDSSSELSMSQIEDSIDTLAKEFQRVDWKVEMLDLNQVPMYPIVYETLSTLLWRTNNHCDDDQPTFGPTKDVVMRIAKEIQKSFKWTRNCTSSTDDPPTYLISTQAVDFSQTLETLETLVQLSNIKTKDYQDVLKIPFSTINLSKSRPPVQTSSNDREYFQWLVQMLINSHTIVPHFQNTLSSDDKRQEFIRFTNELKLKSQYNPYFVIEKFEQLTGHQHILLHIQNLSAILSTQGSTRLIQLHDFFQYFDSIVIMGYNIIITFRHYDFPFTNLSNGTSRRHFRILDQ